MDNIKYLTKLFNDHYAGDPWIDTTTPDGRRPLLIYYAASRLEERLRIDIALKGHNMSTMDVVHRVGQQ